MSYLIANWKANLDFDQVTNFVNTWQTLISKQPLSTQDQIIIAPTSIFYAYLAKQQLPFALALQDISQFAGGAYTGAVTITNLKGLVPQYSILGHSERRREFGETNQLIVTKAKRCWEIGITPIICFDLEELDELAALLRPHLRQDFILAYEPVSAISTSGQAGNLHPEELARLSPTFQTACPDKPFIYGGSVKPDNAGSYREVCAGLLVGSASLQADSFYQIVTNFTAHT